jgi:RNA-binding protein
MPSGKLRSTLRGHGHRLSAIVQVGKAGVTPGLVKQLGQALDDHELVKLKVAADGPADRFAVADQLAALPGVNVVQIVGGAILLYKRHPRVARYEGKQAMQPGAVEAKASRAPAKGGSRAAGSKAKLKVRAGASVKPRARSAARPAGKDRAPSHAKGAPRNDRRSRR